MNRHNCARAACAVMLAAMMQMPTSAAAAPSPTPSAPTTAPVFNGSDCPADLIPASLQGDITARCGWVQVSQRHDRPGLRPIALPVDVFTTPSSDPKATPLLYLSGGPGGPGVDEVTGLFLRSPLGQTVVHQRAVIAFDQRGTGGAEPSLQCPELERDGQDTQTPEQTLAEDALSCRDTLLHEGLEPAAFTTSQTAADVHDIVRALGYAQIDLLGVSYGTTVALVTLRMFPDDVASTILDGVVPPQTDVFAPTEINDSQQLALAQLVSDCNAEAACAAAYPQLADNLAQLAADTEDSVSVDFTDAHGVARHADVSQQMVAHMLQYLIDDPSVNARIPQAATAAVAGDGGPLEPIVSEFARRRASADRQAQSFRSVDYDAVACSDFASGPPLGGREVCDALGVAYQPEMSTPVTSTRPVLLLSGAYDERTPPALADTAAQTLPNNYREVFPATGHGIYEFPQAAACAAQVVGSFLLKPTAQPDDQCLAQIQRPRWVI